MGGEFFDSARRGRGSTVVSSPCRLSTGSRTREDTFHNEVILEPFASTTIELTFLLWTGLRRRCPITDPPFKKAESDESEFAADRFSTIPMLLRARR